jgi:hypothetical protein
MKRSSRLALAALLAATFSIAAAAPPLAGVWNIAASGNASSSGEILFRVTGAEVGDVMDVTVPVIMGAHEDTVARSIRDALGSQLPPDKFNVALGEGGNVLVSDPGGRPRFAIELVNSNVENLRVAVQSVTPAASPTVPPQSAPVEDGHSPSPDNKAPGDAAPPAESAPPPAAAPKAAR